MKILYLLFFLVPLKQCNTVQIKNQDTAIIEYEAHSRGYYQHIVITKNQISISKQRTQSAIVKKSNEDTWKTFTDILKKIDIENIQNLKAPSENRFFDGAAIANLKITIDGKTYETPSFDHGNPPKEIAQLVKEMLSISENIE